MQPGCERLHNVWRTHPQPPNPQSEMGTLATHSGRTFDSLPLVHRGKFMRKHGTTGTTMYDHVWPKTSKDILPANTPLNSGCQGAMQTWSYAFQGFLGSRFDLWLWNLGQRSCACRRRGWTEWTSCSEPSAVHVYIFLHVVTDAMNLAILLMTLRQPCTTRLE